MGVPGLYKFLKQEFKNSKLQIIYQQKILQYIDYIYIDLNAYIYTSYHEILKKTNNHTFDKHEFENDIIVNLIANLHLIIENLQPIHQQIYLCIDGLVPLGKIIHQRNRRYRNKLHSNNELWSTSNISPGTPFMSKLESALQNDVILSLDNICIDTSLNKGEGEHKIVHYIKQNYLKNKERTLKHVILGDDADIVHLTLYLDVYCKSHQFFIQRMNQEWIHIENLHNALNNLLIEKPKNEYFIIDFIFISMFLGNDFLPRIPSLSIYRNGIQILLQIYNQCLHKNKYFSIVKYNQQKNKIDIDNTALQLFLQKLNIREKSDLQNQHEFFQTRFFKLPFHKRNNKQFLEENMYLHKIQYPLTGDLFYFKNKKRYKNKFLYGQKNENIEELYLNTVLWTMKYYLGQPVSWNHYYSKHHAPFISDIFDKLISNQIYFNLKINKEKKIPIINNVIMQQILILPKEEIYQVVDSKYHVLLQMKYFSSYFNYHSFEFYGDYCIKEFLSTYIFSNMDYIHFSKQFRIISKMIK